MVRQHPLVILKEVEIKTVELLNVSYDPTRELYQDFNKDFAKYWKEKHGQTVNVKQSHGDPEVKRALLLMA